MNSPLVVLQLLIAGQPPPAELLRNHRRCARAGKWIQHHVSWAGRCQHQFAQQLFRLLRWMRGLLPHSVAGGRNVEHVLGLGSHRMGLPVLTLLPVSISPVLTGLGLRVLRILQGVRPVGNPHRVHVECLAVALAQVDDALMGTSPVAPQVGFVLVVPDQPPAALEQRHDRHQDGRQNFRVAAHIHGSRRLQQARCFRNPHTRP
jgi:hypothetical protein